MSNDVEKLLDIEAQIDALEVKIDGQQSTLDSISSKLTNGLQLSQIVDSAGDVADVITTNGNKGLVTISPGHVSTDNSTSTVLGGGAAFTGAWEDITNFGIIVLTLKASHASATDGLIVQFSSDMTNVDSTDEYTIPADTAKTFSFQAANQYYRVVYTNGATPQTYFRLQTILKPYYVKPSSHRIADSVSDQDDAELVKAVLTGLSPAGNFKNVLVTNNGNQKISIEEFENNVSSNGNTQLNVTLYDSNGNEPIESQTAAVKTIDYAHHEIHSGSHFFNKDYTVLGNSAVYDILVVAPDTTKWGHLLLEVSTKAEANMIAYANAVASSNGTPMSVFNRDGNSLTTNGVLVFHTPTITSVGTQIARYKTGSGKQIGGEVRASNEVILKQNTKYLFRITNDTVSDNWIDWLIDWYEHTNK